MKLSQVISLYVAHKRALGHRFRSEDAILRAYCRAVRDKSIGAVERDTVLRFLNGAGALRGSPEKKYRALRGLYRFALARALTDRSPLPRCIPKSTSPEFVPHVYSHQELKRLMDAVPASCAGRVRFEANVFRTLLLLLYGSGIRIGEALALTLADIDLTHACLHIWETKFFKTRLVPLGKDMTEVLTQYLAVPNATHGSAPEAPLFCFRNGLPLTQAAAQSAFRRLRRLAGVQREGNARGQPRLHDLRRAFAVHRLIAWYQSGANLQVLLPSLATYLGHTSVYGTQRYLTMTPELMLQASNRFEHYAMEPDHD